MTKKILIAVLLLGNCLFLSAQEWSIRYSGEHPDGYTHFHDGLVDENGVIFLAGQEGPDMESATALLLRIEPGGKYSTYQHEATGNHSKATCIVETDDHRLFVAGNLYNDTDDRLLVLIFDKELNLLEERQYEKEAEALYFGPCRGVCDSYGHVIIATYVALNNEYSGMDYRGVFYTFNPNGDTIHHQYLIKDHPDPVYYLTNFKMRQMWYRAYNKTLLCLVPGYGGIMSFITFDSTFNYIEEHPIWRDQIDKSDHTLFQDCYTDHWYSDDEALFFSSRGDADHNKLRVSRVNTQGEILEFIRLNERTDTIDEAARPRCMAAANDSTFYFSFHSHRWVYYPGNACVYMLNDKLEIIGSQIIDGNYRASLILPTHDGGCITVNDSCAYAPYMTTALPYITKLMPNDFDCIPWQLTHSDQTTLQLKAYPNPCSTILNIPIGPNSNARKTRCRVEDLQGRIILDYIVQPEGGLLTLDVSKLETGIYYYRIYSDRKTLFQGQFIKK